MAELEHAAVPRVSIVVQATDGDAGLRRALASLLDQTMETWEAIVVDGSRGDDLAWVGEVDPRVRVLGERSSNLYGDVNRAIAQSRAPWVAFLRSADTWSAEKLEVQLERASGKDVSVVCSAFIDPGSLIHRYAARLTYERLLDGDDLCISTVLARTDVLVGHAGFSRRAASAEPLDLWLGLLSRGVAFDVVDEPLVMTSAAANPLYREEFRAARAVLSRHRRHSRVFGLGEAAAAARRGIRRRRVTARAHALQLAKEDLRGRRLTAMTHAAWYGVWRLRAARGHGRLA
ncbi:glycosyltransferase family 2 protein [Xylanimonas protaetiae]|uniref:Glycosyltransferase family 2 protein n=1 Tax=Xylanimonas protaetiae TaxID=2509457 RepID=A0A4P6F1B7_9MICO|nr:glycosyltransferase [Xylanimonas protaetiae]QAY69016.1 glycosyltransferase family 2 protein [Xylanimonas protaetiae]